MIRRMACFVGVVWILCSCKMWATVLNCNGSQSDCQSTVNSAVDGDIVNIPAGSFSWASEVSWTNKNITVQGQGQGVTTISPSAIAFYVIDTTKASFRITGMTLQGGGGNAAIELHSEATTSAMYGWRIDHLSINNHATNSIYIVGINWGLIDHCSFVGNANHVIPYAYVDADFPDGNNPGPNGAGAASWALPLHMGSNEAVYVEDSTFVGNGGGLGVNDMEFGARMVFRHNTVSGGTYFQSHSARGHNRAGSMNIELYNNSFDGNGFLRGSLILGGAGVIFNNTIKNYSTNDITFGDQRASQQITGGQYDVCNGTKAWDGNIESSGWPCLDQIGRGPGTLGSEPGVPFYLWHNGTTDTCATGGNCNNSTGVTLNSNPVNLAPYIKATAHSNGDKDYCIGADTMPASCGNHTNAYRPYTYPHPLVSGSTPPSGPPSPPTNLTGIVQ